MLRQPKNDQVIVGRR